MTIANLKVKAIGLGIFTLTVMLPIWANAEVYIIAHTGTPISADDVKEIFTGEKQLIGSLKITPVDNAAAQTEFLQKAIGMDINKYNTTWTKKSFRDGLNPPAVKATDLEVIEFVKRTEGAVGYISTPPDSITVITKM